MATEYNPQLIEFLNANHQNLWVGIPHDDSFWTTFIAECRANDWIEIDSFEWEERIIKYRLTEKGKQVLDTDNGKRALSIDSTGAGSDESVRYRLEHYFSHSLDVKKQDLFRDLQDIDSDLLTNILIDLQREGKVVFDTSGMDIVYHWNTPAPQPQPDGTATEAGYDLDVDDNRYVVTPKGERLAFYSNVHLADMTARNLNTETRTLREQNARLARELDSAQERIAALEAEVEKKAISCRKYLKQIDEAGYYLGQSSDRDENSDKAYNILKGYNS